MLSNTGEIVLVAVCFIMALLNASIGPCGGLLFATMSTVLPPAAVVPVHSVVQGTGAVIRFIFLRRFVDWSIATGFVFGGTLGLSAGYSLLAWWRPPDDVLRFLLGLFILVSISARSSGRRHRSFFDTTVASGVTSFLTVFVGATGPLVAAWISRRHSEHRTVLGTYTACMCFQHGAKVLVFGILGFSFTAFGPLLVTMLLATALGSWCGKQVLLHFPAHALKPIFVVVTFGLGVHLVIDSIVDWIFNSFVVQPLPAGSFIEKLTLGVRCEIVSGMSIAPWS